MKNSSGFRDIRTFYFSKDHCWFIKNTRVFIGNWKTPKFQERFGISYLRSPRKPFGTSFKISKSPFNLQCIWIGHICKNKSSALEEGWEWLPIYLSFEVEELRSCNSRQLYFLFNFSFTFFRPETIPITFQFIVHHIQKFVINLVAY